MKIWNEFIKGIWTENPVLRILLGLCPTLAVTTSFSNGLGMGLATTFVLISSNILVLPMPGPPSRAGCRRR